MDVPDALRRGLLAPDPLLRTGDLVLVGVSGGPDSLALLHALHSLRGEMGLRGLAAAHFHHGLRGQEADDDAAFVADFCAARGIPCVGEKADIAAEAAQAHVSVQQAARTARYAFFARAASSCGADKIATAHTQDDQVETVLMHVLRGTGLDGLRGIPARRGMYVRPLLGVGRAAIEAYCAAHALAPRRDTSNSDASHYARNRVRQELLPLLERDYHPGVREALLRLARIAEGDADFLHAQAQAALREVTLGDLGASHRLTLSRDKLRGLHPGLLPHVLRAALSRVRGTAEHISFRHLEQIAGAVSAAAGAAWGMTTPAPHCRVVVQAQTVTVTGGESEHSAVDSAFSALLPVGGDDAQMPGAGRRVRAEHAALSMLPPPSRERAVFDAAQVHAPTLHVRCRRPGDRLAPRGMAGHTQKVQDIFANAKVPRRERDRVPIVADRDGILWVAGLAAAERGRPAPSTPVCLVLTLLAAPP